MGDGAHDVAAFLRAILAEALTETARRGLDRDGVARELSRLTGRRVSRPTLDQWAAPGSTGRHLPADMIPALVAITGDSRLLDVIATAAGLTLLDRAGAAAAAVGRLQLLEEAARREHAELVAGLPDDVLAAFRPEGAQTPPPRRGRR